MKKYFAALLTVAMILAFCSCAIHTQPENSSHEGTSASTATKMAEDTFSPEETTYPPATVPSVTKNPDRSETTMSATPTQTTTESTPPIVAPPEEIVSSNLVFTSNGDGTCFVSGKESGTDPVIVIPSKSPNGDRVTAIGKYAFKETYDIKQVVIPESITEIREGAFFYCRELEDVSLPDTLTKIGNNAFLGTNLKSISIPDRITEISDGTFSQCIFLESVHLPNTLTRIGASAFEGCGLTSIDLPESVTEIGASAFANCYITSIALPHGITEIAAYTFSSCPITGIIIPTGVTSIGSNAFQGCLFLTYISLPETVSSIGKDAFLHVPTEVYTVYDSAYYLGNWKNPHHILIQAIDKNIDSCQIHENTKVLAPGAFRNCKNLTEITVPNHIYRIPSYAFASSGLRRVTIEYGITEIESNAFDNCGLLEAVIIPGSVLTIGKSAFSRCSKLKSVMIEEGVQSIEDAAFSMTNLLDTITLPKTLTSIGKLMFYCSGDLQDITYNGTKAQWNALPKSSDWDYSMGGRDGGRYFSASYTVHCADGDIYVNR